MTKYAYTVNWDEPEVPRARPSFLWVLVFAVAFAGLVVLSSGLIADGFASAGASRILGLIQSSGDGLVPANQGFSGAYPTLPYLISVLFSKAPQFASAAPYYVDCFAAALLLGLGFQRLVNAGINSILAAVLIFILASNPLFLFVATSGSGVAVALFFAYVFAIGAMAMGTGKMLRGGALVAVAYAGLILSTPLGFYFLLVSAPLLILASRQNFMAVVPPSFYFALVAIPVTAFGVVLMADVGLSGDLGRFLQSLTGYPHFVRGEMGLEPWPYMMGGSPLGVSGVVLAGFFLAFPVLALALTGIFAGGNVLRATLIIAVITMLTGAVTTYLGVLSHPAYLWVFAVPLTLVALEELRNGIGGRVLAVAALLGGIAGGWWLLGLHPTLYLTVWRAEMSERIVDVAQGFPGPAEAAPPLNR